MAVLRRFAALVVVANANVNTGIEDLSVSLLQTRAEKIHRPYHHKASPMVSKKHTFEQDVVKTDGDVATKIENKDPDPAKLINEVNNSKLKGKTTTKEGQTKITNTWKFFDQILGKPIASADLNLIIDQDNPLNFEAEQDGKPKGSKGKGKNKDADPLNLDVEQADSKPKGSKGRGKKEQAEPLNFDVEQANGKPKGSKGQGKTEHADPLNFDVEQSEGKPNGSKGKGKKEQVDLLNFDVEQADGKPKGSKGKGKKEHADHLNFDVEQADGKPKGSKGKGKKEIADPWNFDVEEADGKPRGSKGKGEKEHADHLNLDIVKQTSDKSEATLVRFKGTELAKHAVHMDEMVSTKETHKLAEQDKERNKHSNAKFYAKIASEEGAHKFAEQDEVQQPTGTKTDSFQEYHPGWKLYELEGGQNANKLQTEEQDLVSDQVKQLDDEQVPHHNAHHQEHHKHRANVVSEAMGVAFGDSDSVQVTDEGPEVAKLYSSTASTDEDNAEFWGQEGPSEIDREFTVEGIPMTSVLGKKGQTASQVVLDKVDTHKEKKHAHSGNKANLTQKDHHKLAKKDLHNVTGVTKGSTTSTLATTSRHLTHEEMCEGASMLDFSAATITHSNLGGQGPDSGEETLVYSGITDQDGFVVDLVVTATSPYAPRDATKNGLQDDFGVLNIETNSAVDLLFRFVSGGQPFVMNAFYFTFFDLDQGRAHESRELATIRGFDNYQLSDGTSLDVEELGDSSAIFSSSMRGGKVDNPTSPLSLSHLQRERSVVVSFSDVSEFSVQLSEENYASSQGRNWFFAGPSSIVCGRESKCSTYECPVGYHTRTMAEFLVCAGSRCTTADDRDTCCFEEEGVQADESEDEAELYSKSSA